MQLVQDFYFPPSRSLQTSTPYVFSVFLIVVAIALTSNMGRSGAIAKKTPNPNQKKPLPIIAHQKNVFPNSWSMTHW